MDGSANPVSEVQQDEGKAAAGVSQIKITSIEYDYDQSDTLRESRVLLAIE